MHIKNFGIDLEVKLAADESFIKAFGEKIYLSIHLISFFLIFSIGKTIFQETNKLIK